ncbi:MAG: phage tail protein [Patescibacteria group bacterium]
MIVLKNHTAVLCTGLLGMSALLFYAGTLYPHEEAAAMGSDRSDYTTIHNFNVEIDGVVVGGFKEVDGLESKTEVIEYQEGNERIMHKRPGKTNYSNIILRRGNLHTPELWEWRKKVVEGITERKSGSIIVIGANMEEVVRYNFFEAWPCRWKGPSLNSTSNDALEEEIELCIEYWERR